MSVRQAVHLHIARTTFERDSDSRPKMQKVADAALRSAFGATLVFARRGRIVGRSVRARGRCQYPTPEVYLVLNQIFLGNMAPGEHLCFDLVVRVKEQPRPNWYLSSGHHEVNAPIVASYVDGDVGHNLPVNLANCSGVNSRSTLP